MIKVERIIIITGQKNTFDDLINGCIANGIEQNICVQAENLDQAQEKIKEQVPSVIIFDWEVTEFPQVLEFFDSWRSNPDTRRVPVLVVSQRITSTIIGTLAEYALGRYLEKDSLKKSGDKAVKQILPLIGKNSGPELEFILALEDAYANDSEKDIDELTTEFYLKHPTHPRACIEYGKLLVRNKQFDEAKTLVDNMMMEYPEDLRVINLFARIMMHRRSYNVAIETLRDSAYLGPKDIDRLVCLGESFVAIGNFKDAGESFSQALSVDPENADAQKGMGDVELNTGDVNKALELLNSTASEDEIAALFNNAGVAAIHNGEVKKAIKLYVAALKPLKKNHYLGKVNYNLGLAYKKLNQPEEAKKYFEVAVTLYPELVKAKENLETLNVVDDSGNVHSLGSLPPPVGEVQQSEEESRKFGKIMELKAKGEDHLPSSVSKKLVKQNIDKDSKNKLKKSS